MEKLKRTDMRESYCYASVTQRFEYPPFKRSNAGSNPAGGTERGVAILVDNVWQDEPALVAQRFVQSALTREAEGSNPSGRKVDFDRV